MRNFLLTALLLSATFMVNAQWRSNSDLKYNKPVQVNAYPVNGYLEHLPPDYYSTTKKYPMIVMLHGMGEVGNGSSDLYKAALNGPAWYAERAGKLCVDGECFIVITPQLLPGQNWKAPNQAKFWDYILNKRGLRYDPDRVYLTGLSLGGNGVYEWAYSDYPDADKIAAIAVMAGWGNASQAYKINNRGIAASAFHGTEDPVIGYYKGKAMHDAMWSAPNPYNVERRWNPVQNNTHNVWWFTYRTDNQYLNPNVYQWFLSKRRQGGSGSTPTTENRSPTVSAGPDKTVSIHNGSTSLTASASDPDGNIVKYEWTKISGPFCRLWQADQATLNISDVVTEGTYEFQIRVTDNRGATATDRVRVFKEGAATASTNKAPIVNAGADQSIDINSGSALFQATATDSDGSIVSYQWSKVSGPNCTIWHPQSQKLGVSDVYTAGTYEFKVVVKDNEGATAVDYVKLIKTTNSSNQVPTVSAGPDRTLTQHEGSTILYSESNDPDGHIVKFQWTKVSGPYCRLWHPDKNMLGVSDVIAEGKYTFKLTVTDNKGATAVDYVNINKVYTTSGSTSRTTSGNQAPVANAGADKSLDVHSGSVLFYSSSHDPDGSIAKYQWSKVSGPSCKLWHTESDKLGVSDVLTEGVYEFKLVVTDDKGATDVDYVKLYKYGAISSMSSGETSINLVANSQTGKMEVEEREVVVRNFRTTDTELEVALMHEPNMNIVVMGINGNMILNEPTSGVVNTGSLTNGMYLYHLVTEDGQLMQKGRIIKY